MEYTYNHAKYSTEEFFPFVEEKNKSKDLGLNYTDTRMLHVAVDLLDEKKDEGAKTLDNYLESIARYRDTKSFELLYNHFAPRIKAFIIKQGTDSQLAEEVVQESMVNVWRKAHQFDSKKASAATWIFTIARNRRIDILRKISRPNPDPNDPAFVPDPQLSSLEVVDKEQEAKKLAKIISSLPLDQQTVLKLAFFGEKAHAEVATELNIPLGTVKSRIRLALKKIRTELERSNER